MTKQYFISDVFSDTGRPRNTPPGLYLTRGDGVAAEAPWLDFAALYRQSLQQAPGERARYLWNALIQQAQDLPNV